MSLVSRSDELTQQYLTRLWRSTDRIFLWLMVVQYFGGLVTALVFSPFTVENGVKSIHPHLWEAALLGLLVQAPAVLAILIRPGTVLSRYTVSVCQVLMSAVLIHVSGGRIETHFHVFGSLAFLAFYRDWKILIPATVVVALDHMIRGFYYPLSVYGVPSGAEWRFVEHALWVVFEDVILVSACLRGMSEVRAISDTQAAIEEAKAVVETAVVARTEELKQTELHKTALFESALDGLVSFDLAGIITDVNPAAEAIIGADRSELVGIHFAMLFDEGADRDRIVAGIVDDADESIVNKHVEICCRRPNGEVIPIEMATTQFMSQGKRAFTAIIRDLTETKRMQNRLVRANKLESLGQLSAGVAHEINTPNQYIGDNLLYLSDTFDSVAKMVAYYRELLQSMPESPEKDEALAKLASHERDSDLEFSLTEFPKAIAQALEGVERVGSIIKAMKEFAHPGMSALTAVDVNVVISNTLEVARNEWKYARVVKELDPDLPTIQGHPGELGQVLLNLIVNSAHAIRELEGSGTEGVITIRSYQEPDHVFIEVADNGCGIPESIAPKVFDPFFTTKGAGIGTGQGLSMAQSIITENHFGEIYFVPEPGRGTRFVIKLPKVESRAEEYVA